MRSTALVVSVLVLGSSMAIAVQPATVHHKPRILYSDAPYALVGRTPRNSANGCASCHGGTAEPTMTVAITGPSTAYAGQLATYTITASRGVGTTTYNGARLGAALAASDGAVLSVHSGEPMRVGPFPAPGGGTVASNEVIHDVNVGALHAFSNGSASYQFDFTMPTAAAVGSSHTLYGVSAAGCYATTCVGWNLAPDFKVTTAAPAPPTNLAAGASTGGGVPLSWTASTEGAASYRVVYKSGSVAPASPTDGTVADLGTVTSTTVGGLTPLTTYTFAVYSKVAFSGQTTYSTTAPSVTKATRAPSDYYVNVATGSDTNDGLTPGTAFKTITKGMNSAADGDAINVAPGTYNTASGEVFPIIVFSGRKLISTSGAEVTIIDASGANPRQRVLNVTGSATTLVQGFTITGGLYQTTSIGSNSYGGGILCGNGDQTTITRNIITGNEVRGYNGVGPSSPTGGQAYGGGVVVDFGANTKLTDNIISNNIARGGPGLNQFGLPTTGGNGGGADGGGVFASFGTVTMINNTIFGNASVGGTGGASLGNGGAGGNANDAGAAISTNSTARNNIFLDNSASGGTGGNGTPRGSNGSGVNGGLNASGSTGVSNNVFFGNTASGATSNGDTGTSALLSDPQVHSPSNFHLRYGSPAIAAGTATGAPPTDFDGTARANPPSIGAYEAAALTAASTSCSTPATGVTTAIGSTGVSVNLSTVNGNVCADFYASGRNGSVPTSNASPYFWTVATTATSLSGTVTFDWGGISSNGVGNPTTVQLLRRGGSGTPWSLVSSVTRSGTTISTSVTGFSDFALGGLLANGVHGDANGDGQVDVPDVFYLLNYLFAGGNPPAGFSDCNADGRVNVLDVFYLVNHIFAGGPAPQ